MRIGMLVDTYKPRVNGITNAIALNKRYLESLGHHVFVFTFGDLDYEDDELRVVRSPGVTMSSNGYTFGFRYNRLAQRKVKTMDVVHAHHPFLSGPLALRYCKPVGIPIVFTNHTRYDLYAQYYVPVLGEALGPAFVQAMLPGFCERCDLVVAPSQGLEAVLRELGVTCSIEVVPNGIDVAPFRNVPAPLPRQELGVPEGRLLFIYTGRLGPEKNLTFLVRAFAAACASSGSIHLLLVGDGPELENLRDQVAHYGVGNRVHFAGHVAYAELPRYLAAADVFVTASVTEVHPLSVIEAMAAGLPVLGIVSPGISDTVVDGENGSLSQHDLQDFSGRMLSLAEDAPARARLAHAARQASDAYAVERTSETLLSHYQRLVARSSSRRPRGTLRHRLRALLP